MKTIKLTHGNVYGYITELFERGKEYEVTDELADILLKEGYEHYDQDLRQLSEVKYFTEVVKEKAPKATKSTKETEVSTDEAKA